MCRSQTENGLFINKTDMCEGHGETLMFQQSKRPAPSNPEPSSVSTGTVRQQYYQTATPKRHRRLNHGARWLDIKKQIKLIG